MCFFECKIKYLFCPLIYTRFSFLRSQLYILETIVEHVIQATKVTLSPACEGPQNDSFSAIFVDSDEEGKTRRVSEVQISTAETGNGRGGSPKMLPKQAVLKTKGQEKSDVRLCHQLERIRGYHQLHITRKQI